LEWEGRKDDQFGSIDLADNFKVENPKELTETEKREFLAGMDKKLETLKVYSVENSLPALYETNPVLMKKCYYV